MCGIGRQRIHIIRKHELGRLGTKTITTGTISLGKGSWVAAKLSAIVSAQKIASA